LRITKIFGSATLTILAFLLLVSILAHQAPLFLLAGALLLAAGLSALWRRYCLTGLEYRRHFSRRCVEFGGTIDLDVEIVNRKILPLSWLEVEDEVPAAIAPAQARRSRGYKPERTILESLLALRPYERVRRRYHLPCLARGEHVFGPVRLRTGDLFGLVSEELSFPLEESVVVYPRVVPLTALGLPAQNPLGDRRARSWLFEDPSRFAGVRERRPEDALRRIHWAASARSQTLQVKVFEPSTTQKLILFLNVVSSPRDWWGMSYDPDALELAISTAASIAAWGLAQRYHVGLKSNGVHRLRSLRVGLEPAGDADQLPRILETLGRLQPHAARAFARTLAEESRRLPFGSTIVAVTPVLGAAETAELIALRRRGYPVVLVLTGRQTTTTLDGIVIRHVGPPEMWSTASAIALG
jgi:uncharacterized protein (DUF58 family)